jgi:hypothetical protein
MTSDESNLSKMRKLSKMERFEYIRKNKALVDLLYESIGLENFVSEGPGLTHDEIVEYLEEKGENTNGLMIRLDRGLKLDLIKHNEVSSLKNRRYSLSKEGEKLYDSAELSKYLDMLKKRREKTTEKIREKTKYIV